MTDPAGEHEPARWYSTNLVGIPAPVLGSAAFNRTARTLCIAGTRQAHRGLFSLLEHSHELSEAADMFSHYMNIAFGLRRPDACTEVVERRRWRSSYLKLLSGWGLDSNSAAGAVLKGWVESRFGLVPGFHKAPLRRFPSPAWLRYVEEKASSRYHNNNIHQQLDLLYDYCQWALTRFLPLGQGLIRLWRGSCSCEEQLIEGSLRARRCIVHLNNLVSFSLSREEAECFGDWVFEALVSPWKILFFPGLLPAGVLQGENEVLVIGGEFDAQVSYV